MRKGSVLLTKSRTSLLCEWSTKIDEFLSKFILIERLGSTSNSSRTNLFFMSFISVQKQLKKKYNSNKTTKVCVVNRKKKQFLPYEKCTSILFRFIVRFDYCDIYHVDGFQAGNQLFQSHTFVSSIREF